MPTSRSQPHHRSNLDPATRHRNRRSERGASMVEYALLVALIAIVAIVALRLLGNNTSDKFNTTAAEIAGIPPTNCSAYEQSRPNGYFANGAAAQAGLGTDFNDDAGPAWYYHTATPSYAAPCGT